VPAAWTRELLASQSTRLPQISLDDTSPYIRPHALFLGRGLLWILRLRSSSSVVSGSTPCVRLLYLAPARTRLVARLCPAVASPFSLGKQRMPS